MLILYHSSVIVLNIYAMWYDQQYVELPYPSDEFANMPFKARGVFLTFWCMVLQTLYFAISLLNDIIGTNETAPNKLPLIRKIKDTVFSLAFTVAIYVAAAFWGMYLIDKDNMFPENMQLTFPNWLNHTMHTLIAPFILLELFITKRNYPSRLLGISITLIFTLAYVIMILAIYFKTGFWAYPFLNAFSWYKKLFYIASSSVIAVLIYLLGEKLDSLSKLNIRTTFFKRSSDSSVKNHD